MQNLISAAAGAACDERAVGNQFDTTACSRVKNAMARHTLWNKFGTDFYIRLAILPCNILNVVYVIGNTEPTIADALIHILPSLLGLLIHTLKVTCDKACELQNLKWHMLFKPDIRRCLYSCA